MPQYILGISAYYHDSASAIIADGEIIAAAQEERFTRKKHDSAFPLLATRYVLQEAGIDLKDVSFVAFYDKPFIKFERLLETYHAFAPRGLTSFYSAIPVWIKEKLFMRNMLKKELLKLDSVIPSIVFPEHHLSHGASAFYPSPFQEAAIITVDGVGEWATTTIGMGKENAITVLKELHFPHSLGLLYSAFTYYCGFKVNSGEYKLMGLAPYGKPGQETESLKQKIRDNLVDIREDGSIVLNMRYFNFATGLTMCNDRLWAKLFAAPPRKPESEITQTYMNLALAIQEISEEILLALIHYAKKLTELENLVLAGGVALNCVANGKLLRSGVFKNIWIQPAAGDAGGALGAAFAAWHISENKPRTIPAGHADAMKGAYLGPAFSDQDVKRLSRRHDAPTAYYQDFESLCDDVAIYLDKGEVVGWFQGRMEFGPRALGNRSILGDARNPEMQKKMNLKIKYREGFRPFAPSVLEEDIQLYFDLDRPSSYMLFVAPVQREHRNEVPENYSLMPMWQKLYYKRSDIPAVTHVDFSARIQSVSIVSNERYWRLISAFKRKTGVGMVVNTSFNVRGEPIVCTPEDAYRCFMRTEMDWLVIGNHVFDKRSQPPWIEKDEWKNHSALD
jgi:carbamoyltransferase